MKVLSLNRLGLVSDELDKMSPKKLLISLVCGAISGVIVAWLVLKFLESEGSQLKGGHKEMKEVKDERDCFKQSTYWRSFRQFPWVTA